MTQAILAASLWESPVMYAAIGGIASALLLGCRYLVKVSRWTGEVDKDRKGIRDTLNKIQTDIREIRLDVKSIFRQLPPVTVQEGSPRRLTELGEVIAGQLDATEWARKTAQGLKDRVESGDPYDLQEFCFAFVHDGLEPHNDLQGRINRSAYENGVQRSKVMDVLAIVLRDELILRRKVPLDRAGRQTG